MDDEDEPEGGSLDLGEFGDDADGTLTGDLDDAVPIDVELEEKGPTRFQMIEYMNQREWLLRSKTGVTHSVETC
jgi:hypothetical protein